jgi:hypothetical protein
MCSVSRHGLPGRLLVFFTTFNTTDCGDGSYTYYFVRTAATPITFQWCWIRQWVVGPQH